MKTINQRAHEWIVSGDTGMSSKAIWAACMGVKSNNAMAPSDPADFGRCYRLLKLIPEWAKDMQAISDISLEWALLVARWNEFCGLYEAEYKTGKCSKLYTAMKELQKQAHS